MKLEVADTIVYPNHGVAVVEQITERAVGGQNIACYHLRILGNGTSIIVPVANVKSVGLRRTAKKEEVTATLSRLRQAGDQGPGTDWRGRFKQNSERLRSGKLHEVAEVLKSLSALSASKGLSFRERRMLERAKNLVVTEFAAVQQETPEVASAHVDAALSASVMTPQP